MTEPKPRPFVARRGELAMIKRELAESSVLESEYRKRTGHPSLDELEELEEVGDD